MKGLATGIEKSQGLVADAMKDVQMDMQLDTSSMKPANNLNKTDITGITGMLAQLIQVMSAGQEIYFITESGLEARAGDQYRTWKNSKGGGV